MLETEIQRTIHGYKPGVEALAARLGRSSSLLYRAANPNDETQLSLLLLQPLMTVTRDFRILRFFARTFGYALVKIPMRPPRNSPRTIAEMQKVFNEAVGVLIKRVDGAATRAEVVDTLWTVIETSATAIKALECENSLQLEESQLCLNMD